MAGDEELRAKLAKVEALFRRAGSDGERAAAGAAMERLRDRLGVEGEGEAEVRLSLRGRHRSPDRGRPGFGRRCWPAVAAAPSGPGRLGPPSAASFGLSRRPAMGYRHGMDDERVNGRIEEAVLALLYLGIFKSHPAAEPAPGSPSTGTRWDVFTRKG